MREDGRERVGGRGGADGLQKLLFVSIGLFTRAAAARGFRVGLVQFGARSDGFGGVSGRRRAHERVDDLGLTFLLFLLGILGALGAGAGGEWEWALGLIDSWFDFFCVFLSAGSAQLNPVQDNSI